MVLLLCLCSLSDTLEIADLALGPTGAGRNIIICPGTFSPRSQHIIKIISTELLDRPFHSGKTVVILRCSASGPQKKPNKIISFTEDVTLHRGKPYSTYSLLLLCDDEEDMVWDAYIASLRWRSRVHRHCYGVSSASFSLTASPSSARYHEGSYLSKPQALTHRTVSYHHLKRLVLHCTGNASQAVPDFTRVTTCLQLNSLHNTSNA
jgi:hypothetical protein